MWTEGSTRVVLAGAERAGKSRLFDAIAAAPNARVATDARARWLETTTSRRRYVIADAPADMVDSLLEGAHVFLLVVAANDGPMPATRRHVEAARRAGIAGCVIYLDDASVEDVELTDLVEMELRELAARFEYGSHTLAVLRGRGDPSRHVASGIAMLASALDAT